MTPIANCKVEFSFQCPKRWSKLAKTKDPSIRFCNVCNRDVHFCTTLEEVHQHASRGNCIAVPPAKREIKPLMGTPLYDNEIRYETHPLPEPPTAP